MLASLLIGALSNADRELRAATARYLKICPLTRVPLLVIMVLLLYHAIIKGSEECRERKVIQDRARRPMCQGDGQARVFLCMSLVEVDW